MEMRHRNRCDQRGLLGRFCQHAIASGQRRRDLPREDRQREVPRADGGEDTAGRGGGAFRLIRVIAQEIHRFAQLAHGIAKGFARLPRKAGEDPAKIGLHQICRTAQHRCALGHGGLPRGGSGESGGDAGRIGLDHTAHLRACCGVGDSDLGAACRPCDHRASGGQIGGTRRLDPRQRRLVGEIEPRRVRPIRAKDRGGGEQARGRIARGRKRIQRDVFRRHILIDDLVHEARIRAVLQQAPHQIGQQIAMRADGRVDPAAGLGIAQHDIMQTLAHPVQALELERIAPRHAQIGGHFQDRRHRMRVMRGELRVDPARIAEQFFRIGNIADIGRHFRGEEREIAVPFNLRELHLRIPIGPFHETHHDLAVQLFCRVMQPVKDRARALAVGLHHDAEPIPACQLGILQHRLDHPHRQGETRLFFGVNIEAHAALRRLPREIADHRHQFGHHAGLLCHLIAWMQRGEFDRDPWVGLGRALIAGPRNRLDRIGIGRGVARRILRRHRGFAQHIIAIGIALRLAIGRALQRRLNGLAQHKLPPHFLHRLAYGGTDHRLAEAFDRPAQHPCDPRLRGFQHTPCQHQGPCRGIDQRRGGFAQMAAPIRRRNLILDQRINRPAIRHPQHCFGQTHQRHAFARGQAVFGKEMLHDRGLCLGADPHHQPRRARGNLRAHLCAQRGLLDQRVDHSLLRGKFFHLMQRRVGHRDLLRMKPRISRRV